MQDLNCEYSIKLTLNISRDLTIFKVFYIFKIFYKISLHLNINKMSPKYFRASQAEKHKDKTT
jgi:hypothetical protein